MKHFRICIIIFISILTMSVFSYSFTKTQINHIYTAIEKYTDIQSLTSDDINTIKAVKDRFYDKKNMLQLFINKEHINHLETDILLLEDSIINNNAENCRENSIQALVILTQIQGYTLAID